MMFIIKINILKQKKTIYYWSPHINSNVATVKAVMNSILSLKRYSNNYEISLINLFGEWENSRNNLKDVKLIDFLISRISPIKKNVTGFIKSRFFYILLGIFSIGSLYKLLKRDKPDYIIIHLLTFIPLSLLIFFNFKTKFILRISGFPKLTLFRKFLWKLSSKKIYKVFCPTEETIKILKSKKIFQDDKIHFLEDPVLEISKINKKKREKVGDLPYSNKYILAIGRLSEQKNFNLLIEFFSNISKKDKDLSLVIVGEGELRSSLKKNIFKKSLEKKVFLLGYKKNVFNLLSKCQCFILSSLWEDPGFVIVEAASVNTQIVSSNCKNGPYEILSGGEGGYLYESNNEEELLKKLEEYKNDKEEINFRKKIIVKKNVKNFTLFNHFLNFKKILN